MKLIKWAGLFCFLLSATAGCPPRRLVGRPAWVVSHNHEKYSNETYLTGTGEGSSLEEASQAAREDLIDKLKMRLGIILREKKQSVDQDSWFNPYQLPPEDLAKIARGKIVHTWKSSDGSNHAALAALERALNAGYQEWGNPLPVRAATYPRR